ncbi:ATP-binding cassette domain-containing protein [Desulfovibrio legallii]|uniref:Putative ATP-binding cassette transporter n=1 Tax=Desulfovibrio legallii TaxID=571438 RepID=A0A1G7JHY9_9BACT|nr:ATP-binding cassette domain-containing protein [Desulfovibrio legallii]SDF24557.1 putative ATP-binding cassette transporter [Desulfovibrio legallii]
MLHVNDSLFLKLVRDQAGDEGGRLTAACLASGVMQGLAVFAVLQGLQELSDDGLRLHTFLGFLAALGGFYFLFRYITGRSAQLALRGVMRWRMRIASKLRGISLPGYEALDQNRIQAALLDGREMVVEAARMLTAAAANTVMLVLAFLKMGTVSLSGTVGVFLILGLGLWIFLRLIRSVQEHMGPALRADQRFSASLRDLYAGFSQLKMHKPKTTELFGEQIIPDLDKASRARDATERRHALGISFFAMFNLLILGLVLFLMPGILGLSSDDAATLLVLCMFSLSPLMSLVTFVPLLTKVELSLRELAEVEAMVDAAAEPFEAQGVSARWQQPDPATPPFHSLSLHQVRFDYHDRHGARLFGIVAEDFSLRRGEMVFIRGGNGSGKSTFLKVLAGLYASQDGKILLNGIPLADVDMAAYRNLFTVLPTEYHLFARPLGLGNDVTRFTAALRAVRLENKVRLLADGAFSTLDLSAGQRKRLALACALAEGREVFLFDEVAADFDPGFRKYFYEELLPDLIRRGGTVLAISHDDRYFHVADRVLTMSEGRFVAEPAALPEGTA